MIKRVEKSDTLLVKVYSTETEVSTSSFALVKLSEVENKVKQLNKSLVEIKQQNESLSVYQLTSFDCNCMFINESDESTTPEELTETLEEIFVNDEEFCYVELDVDTLNDLDILNTNVDMMIVTSETFNFSSYTKYSSVKLTTAQIYIPEIFPS